MAPSDRVGRSQLADYAGGMSGSTQAARDYRYKNRLCCPQHKSGCRGVALASPGAVKGWQGILSMRRLLHNAVPDCDGSGVGR